MKSIVSYPDRGVGGKSSYRGNCSPRLIEDLINQYKLQDISDYMCGSGTTEDVANRMGITSHCYDLNRGFDLLNMEIPEQNNFIFWHPPYADMITYAGEQYDAEAVKAKYGIDPIASDLSHIKDWDEFVRAMNYCCLKQFSSLETGGRMAVLMGDMKRKGKLYSMLCSIAKPGTLESIVVKAQWNCMSDRKTYSNNNFIPIVHEYLMIVRKDVPLFYEVQLSNAYQVDARNVRSASWKDVVYSVISDAKKPLALDDIYAMLDGTRKTENNPHWREKVRQTLQRYPNVFSNVRRGVWAVAA